MPASQRRVLVTGGGSGIGEVIVSQLKQAGYLVDTVFYSSKKQPTPIREKDHSYLYADLSQQKSTDALIQTITRKRVRYYGFVHCSGVSYDKLTREIDASEAKRVMNINFWAFVQITQAVISEMQRARSGRVIAIGSIASDRAVVGNSIYSASKSALISFVRSSSIETARRSVTINAISPGYINSPMLTKYHDQLDAIVRAIPARRLGEPFEVAECVKFLLSEDSSYVNGANIVIDGALSA